MTPRPTRRGILALAPAAALAPASAAGTAPHSDAALLAAVARFCAYNARHVALFTTIEDEDERDDAYEEFREDMEAALVTMCDLPATTLAGIAARGLAIAEFYPERLNPEWACDWDGAQIMALLRDLVGMAGDPPSKPARPAA